MRITICLLSMILSGCQGISILDRVNRDPPLSVWHLWEQYRQCLTSTDLAHLLSTVDRLQQAMLAGTEPPAWIAMFGEHVARQPLRTAVDPEALGAACTLRTAAVMIEAQRLAEARSLYQRVIDRYVARELAYYREQAKYALDRLEATSPTVVALRANLSR